MRGETKNPARTHIKGLAVCSLICLALLAAPMLYCGLNSGNKAKTNEEVVLNWIDKYRRGQTVKKADPPKAKKTAETIIIREEQIKAVDKDQDGWLVTTKGNRLLFVPKSDD